MLRAKLGPVAGRELVEIEAGRNRADGARDSVGREHVGKLP
jgi:hypothetical protein